MHRLRHGPLQRLRPNPRLEHAPQTSHCREQEEARQRAIERGEPDPFPPTLLTNGAVLDPAVLPLPSVRMVGANPSHFCLPYQYTDRFRQPTPFHQVDVSHLYAAHLAARFKPVRTLDPLHKPTTRTSTSHVGLLSHPTAKAASIRHAICTAGLRASLPPLLMGQVAVWCTFGGRECGFYD